MQIAKQDQQPMDRLGLSQSNHSKAALAMTIANTNSIISHIKKFLSKLEIKLQKQTLLL